MKRRAVCLFALLVMLPAVACAGSGLPDRDGVYGVQSRSVTWDGDQYRFFWADSSGALHQVRSKDVKLVQDDRNYLQVLDHKGILHLLPSEPVGVLGQDNRGQFSDSWFPFLAGAALGNVLGGSRTPTYYYPPTNVYGRGDQLDGSVTTTAPKPPDYSTVKPPPNAVHPAAGSVAGQSSGTGGGDAATNKLGGSGSCSGSGSSGSVGGQASGTGGGSAAGNKAGSPSQSGGAAGSKSGGGSSPSRSGGGSAGGSRGHR